MIMRPRLVKILGERGPGLVEVEGKLLAVLQERYWNFHNHGYHAPIRPEGMRDKACEDYLDALRENDLIVMRRDQDPQSGSLPYDGYIGVFRFSNLHIDAEAFSLSIVERYASPRA